MGTLFRRVILHLACLYIFSCLALAADVATYNSATGSLNLPVVVVGQKVYAVDMQQTKGLNFDVTRATQIPIVDTLDYYNLENGITWRYRGYRVDDNGTTLENWTSNRTVQGSTIIDDLACYFISEPNRYRSQITHICYDDESVYHIEDNETRFKMHDRYVYAGKQSSWAETEFNLSIESKVDFEYIYTPAYSGEALVVFNKITDTVDGYSWSEKACFVEGVGLVKTTNDGDNGNYFYQSRTLTSYSGAVPGVGDTKIIGTWDSNGDGFNVDVKLIFYEDGTWYLYKEDSPTSGYERGTYVVSGNQINFTVTLDTNGNDDGFDSIPSPVNFLIEGNVLTFFNDLESVSFSAAP